MLLHSDMNLDLLTLITNIQRHCSVEKKEENISKFGDLPHLL